MQIDAIQKRATDLAHITLDLRRRAVAVAPRVGAVTAGTRIECGDEHEVRRVRGGGQGAADRHPPIFERLPQYLERAAIELGQFVKKQHPVMREADLPRRGGRATTRQSRVTDRVVRLAEGTHREQRLGGVEFAERTVDAACFNRFPGGQLG